MGKRSRPWRRSLPVRSSVLRRTGNSVLARVREPSCPWHPATLTLHAARSIVPAAADHFRQGLNIDDLMGLEVAAQNDPRSPVGLEDQEAV